MQLKKTCLAVLAALALAACGGGDDGPTYSRLVSFGDSLSDVGSYKTPGIAALGGGKYTVNGGGNEIWIEQLSVQLGLAAPCAAQTGLEATGIFAALAAAITNHAGCTAYGQGGSRVTNPVGPWNKALLTIPGEQTQFQGQLGQLTVPVVQQIANHLAASGGSFTGKELVTVLAGANDVFVATDELAAVGAAAAAAATPTATSPAQVAAAVQAAVQSAAPTAIAAMAQAGTELAVQIKTQIVAKGAKRVIVLNLPNISKTPATLEAEEALPGSQQLVDLMTTTFNAALKAGLDGTAEVLQIDFYAQNSQHSVTPAAFGLTNANTPACTNTFPDAPGFLAPSLTCTTATTLVNSSRYLFADTVHPTPYGHTLVRDMAFEALKAKDWL
ncbi:SGNH/GDSL hydrolase family protein [Pseudorhodoferax soli]|uniref:Phospholipase/lecithinase/hemolysin n=1 Tax=Pseudorhodoferax soli TaxID=545864 RepID=A0A368XTZ8_9BURK|nr:SGNH/GDSL hydrolase family protein [Pseudorhodoferax soli]RCW71530.1 phospholipase/lecithinase/hemolysin [Pseudorhodoferax soli]